MMYTVIIAGLVRAARNFFGSRVAASPTAFPARRARSPAQAHERRLAPPWVPAAGLWLAAGHREVSRAPVPRSVSPNVPLLPPARRNHVLQRWAAPAPSQGLGKQLGASASVHRAPHPKTTPRCRRRRSLTPRPTTATPNASAEDAQKEESMVHARDGP